MGKTIKKHSSKKQGKFNSKSSKGSKPFKKIQLKEFKPAEKIKVNEISSDKVGKRFILEGTIERIVQTPGPTVFYISDGTGNLPLKGFDSPGTRAYPEIEEGSVVNTIVKIEEFRGDVEGEIVKITKLTGKDKQAVLDEITDIQRERSKVVPPKFLIKSKILDKLKDDFVKAATEIRLAIIQNRPIIVRHHNDADGYSSGYALERAILPLIEEQHGGGKSAWEFFTRAPCSAPFYEIDDSIRDAARSLSNTAKFSNKLPLIIIADNGSSPEDLMAVKQGKIHGIDFIVIDHHGFDEDVISDEVLVHINPFLVGEDGAAFSAGMLCVEIARFINPDVKNVEQIAAMAGIADRIDIVNEKDVEAYIKIAKDLGYSKKLLGEIANVIDYVSAKIKFMEVREYIEVLFGEPKEKQTALVNLMGPYIREFEKKGLQMAKSNSQIEKIGKTNLQSLNVEGAFPGFGFYPKPGKAVGLLHDYAKEEKNITNLITIGVMNTAITIRATDEANFSVHGLITFIDKKIPDAFVNGGGHKNAGSINFIPIKQEEVLKTLKEFIKSRA